MLKDIDNIGGTTGVYDCEEEMDCNGDPGGSAYFDDCGCIGGNTGISECPLEEEPTTDCAGVQGGTAYNDPNCGCIGGTTGITACPPVTDCAGVVGGTAINDPNCGCIGGTTGFVTCPPDCDDAKKINERMSNSTLFNQHIQIQLSTATTNMEYGAEQNLSTFPPGTTPAFNNVAVRTNNSTSSFSPNFTWNATDGYTIGISHGHPGDGAPSPADLIYAYVNLSHPDLVAGGQSAIDYYKANFSITVTTRNETFIVTVSDWTALGTLYNNHYGNPSASNTAWGNEASNYSVNNPTATYGEYTAYASLKLYGSAISILKGNTNATNFKPMNLNANNSVVTIPCPQ